MEHHYIMRPDGVYFTTPDAKQPVLLPGAAYKIDKFGISSMELDTTDERVFGVQSIGSTFVVYLKDRHYRLPKASGSWTENGKMYLMIQPEQVIFDQTKKESAVYA